jgi:hypothetical protein
MQRTDGLLGGVVGFGVQSDRVVQSCTFGETRVHTLQVSVFVVAANPVFIAPVLVGFSV